MSRGTKTWLIIAAILIVVGTIVFGGMMMSFQWDFTKLSTVKYETNKIEVNEAYENISVITNTADVVLVPSETATSSVVCYEQQNLKHSVEVKDGTLVIRVEDTRKWYEYIGIQFGTAQITVYIPKGIYGALSIKSSTGDVTIPKDVQFESIDVTGNTGDVKCLASVSEHIKIKLSTGSIQVKNVSAKAVALSVTTGSVKVEALSCSQKLAISVSTGKTDIKDVTCSSLTSTGDTGDIIMKKVIATEKLSLKRNTGDVKLESCDAGEIVIKTDTGDVKGSLQSEKIFFAHSDTGRVSVPRTTTGGKCEITTDTGNIKITIE